MKNILILSALCLSFTSHHSFATSDKPERSLETPLEKICSPTECYTIIKELGEGAFGKVYAVENSSGMPFAIKCYKENLDWGMSPGLLGDAEREFQRGQLLNHPHIIKSFDLFTSTSASNEQMTNLVLDLVEGQTVHNTKKGLLSLDGSFSAARQLIDALRYAFSLNLMHLDLHNGNVMLDNHTNIMVIDLASFYSFDELFNFVKEESKAKTEIEKQPTKSASQPQVAAMKMVMVEKTPVESKLEPVRAEKLRKFFKQNPQLFHAIKEFQEEKSKPAPQKARMLKMVSKKTSAHTVTEMEEPASIHPYSDHPEKSFFQSYYFDRVSEMCFNVISKSNLNREEKINLRAEIKKIAWNYEEDIEEGKKIPFDFYLEELIQTLQTS